MPSLLVISTYANDIRNLITSTVEVSIYSILYYAENHQPSLLYIHFKR